MNQFVKMGEIPMEICKELQELVNQKDYLICRYNLAQEDNKTEAEQIKLQLDQITREIKNLCNKIIEDYHIEIIPGAKIRIDFKNGDVFAVLTEDGQVESDIRVF